jgi:hypothetical protein
VSNYKISRRYFLAGSGAGFLLPLLESLMPLNKALAASANDPRRYVGIYFPNGTYNRQGDAVWYPPTGLMQSGNLPPVLQPFSANIGDFSVLKSIGNYAQNQMSGHGGHVSACISHFTGEVVNDMANTSCQVKGSSFDQIVANVTGKKSLNLIPGLINAYPDSCGFPYGYYMSYNNGKPIEPTMNPVDLYRRVLNQVVPTTPQAPPSAATIAKKKSVLDSALADLQSLQAKLGKSDRSKLDDYMTSIRAMELKIAAPPVPNGPICSDPGAPSGTLDNTDPNGDQTNYIARIQAMFDVVAFAFQCDLARSVGMTFDGDNLDRRIQGISNGLLYNGANPNDIGTHSLSHFAGQDPGGREKGISRDRLYVSLVMYLVNKLKAAKDPSGSAILDNTIIDAGFSVVDGNHQDGSQAGVPQFVAGGRNFMNPGYAYDVGAFDKRDLFYTYSQLLKLGLTDFKGNTKMLKI